MWGRNGLPDGLPRLYNYQSALNHYKSTTPLTRGPDAGLVPLGLNRRYKRSQILQVENKIICRFWSTDVLTYWSDGRVEIFAGTWHSPTTLEFLNSVMGDKFRRHKNKIYFIDQQETPFRFYKIPYDRSLTIQDGKVTDPQPEEKYVLNRAKMKELQQRFKPFVVYCKDMVNLFDGENYGERASQEMEMLQKTYGWDYFKNMVLGTKFTTKSIPYIPIEAKQYKYRPQHQVTRHDFFEKLEDACAKGNLDLFYPLYFILLHNSVASQYNYVRSCYMYSNDPKRIKKYFDELVKFQYTHIFDREEQPIGNIVSDSNAKYFIAKTTTTT